MSGVLKLSQIEAIEGEHFPNESDETLGMPAMVQPEADPVSHRVWIQNARAIAIALTSVELSNNHIALAERVRLEMVERHSTGERGMTGKGDRIPDATTIARRALKGIATKAQTR